MFLVLDFEDKNTSEYQLLSIYWGNTIIKVNMYAKRKRGQIGNFLV